MYRNRKLFAEFICDHNKARKYIDTYSESFGGADIYEAVTEMLHLLYIYPQKYMSDYGLTTEQYLDMYKLLEEYGCPVDMSRVHYMTTADLEKELREGQLTFVQDNKYSTYLCSSDKVLSKSNHAEDLKKRIILQSYGINVVRASVSRFECYQKVSEDWYEKCDSAIMCCIPGKCTHPPGLKLLDY